MSDNSKRWTALIAALLIPSLLVVSWANGAAARLQYNEGAAKEVAVASVTNDSYCTPELKSIVRRVAAACGLLEGGGGGRGCQPMQAQKIASLSGKDFNALFTPLAQRAHIIQFDPEKT